MKNKIGSATCGDCGYPDCDVGVDKNGHPYAVCWGSVCNGEQYFTKGKAPKVNTLLSRMSYKPIAGGPTADELRAKYGLTPARPAPAPPKKDPAPAPKKEPAPAAAAPAKKGSGLLID